MNRPFFSIIIPLYNKGKTIRDTLNSIICQSFVNYEVLVINDGSTDNSCEEVLRIVDKRIILFTKENGGPSSARNYGMDKAVGEYVYFLDGDDKIIPDALWNMYKVIEMNSEQSLFCFNCFIVNGTDKKISTDSMKCGIVRWPFVQWLLCDFCPKPGMFVYRNGTINMRFNEDLFRYEDTDFFFNLMRTRRFYYSSLPIFEYNQETLEGSYARKNCGQDFICNLQPEGKTFWERLCLYNLYLESCFLYPTASVEIYGNTFEKLSYKVMYSLMMRYLSFKWRKRE